MVGEKILLVGLCTLLAAAASVPAQSQIYNPSFEDGLIDWVPYSYLAPPAGSPGLPETGCVGAGCTFDVLIPTSTPDGQNVCGMQSWGDTKNGGVRQYFLWGGGPATISVTARAYSAKYDYVPFDNGCRVRMGLVNGYSEDRSEVTSWTTFPWSESWHTRRLSIPGPGEYTLFIESYQPNTDAIMSTLWDNVVLTDLPPILVTSGPTVSLSDPQNPDTTVTVSWTTDVPSTSRVDYGLSQTLGDFAEDAALLTEHSITITGLQPSSTYYFTVTSTAPDYASWVSDISTFYTPIQFKDIVTGLSADGESTIITWKTDVPTTTQVEYGPDDTYGNTTVADPTLTTDHEAVLAGLPEDSEFHFRVWGRNPPYYHDAASGDHTFRTLPAISQALENGGFEDPRGSQPHSLYPWVQYASRVQALGYHPIDGLVGSYPQGGPDYWFSGIQAFDGSYFVGAATNSEYKNGGVFQRVYYPPGEICTLTAHFATYRSGGSEEDMQVRLGIDADGGVDPESPNVKWWSGSSPSNNSQWHAAAVTDTAGPNGLVTVFLDIRENWPLQWQVIAIDGVTLGPPTQMSIGALKAAETGLSAILENKIVTCLDTETYLYPGYVKAYIEEDDRSSGLAVLFDNSSMNIPEVGNKVSVVGSLSSPNNEAVLTAESWTLDTGTYPLPKPVGLPHRALGGFATNQPPLYSSVGLCTVGLRVRVAGRVTWVDFEGVPYYDVEAYIDDGTGLQDASGMQGVDVRLVGKPTEGVNIGDYIAVTGVLKVLYVDPDYPWVNGNEYYTYRVVTNTDTDWDILATAAP